MSNRFQYMLKQNLSYYKNRFQYCLRYRFVAIRDNIIIFESYGGTRYADSVRAIYEELLEDENYRSFYFVWAFKNPEDYAFLLKNHHTVLVRKGTKEYRKYYAQARFWINNVTVPDYFKPKKGQIYVETWHGTPLKRLGCDIETDADVRQTRGHMHRRYRAKGRKVTYFLSPSDYYTDVIASAFAKKDKASAFLNTGYPRNDKLFNFTPEQVASYKEKYHIPTDKKILLYAPTWRESLQDNEGHFTLKNGIDFNRLFDLIGDDYVILYRAHHQIKSHELPESSQLIDVSSVDDVEDLYLVSDMLITDYSSTMFDFANLHRPMIFHMYDRREYEEDIRGFYLSTDELPGPITATTEELANAILSLPDDFSYEEKYTAFHEKYNQYDDGKSAKRVIRMCFDLAPHKQPASERFLRFCKKMLNRAYLVFLICKYNTLGFFRSHGLFHNNNSLRLEKLKNCHCGDRCFLIGNGPSLTAHDLDLLKNEYTFGTNMVYKIFDQTEWRPSYHCISDSIYASKLGLELSKKVKAPLFTTERTYRRMHNKPIDTTYVHTLQSERYKVRGNIQAYCMVKATVLSLAAEMAFHMGFKEIYLLGVDCTNPHTKGGHFTDNYTTKEVAETDINRIKTRMNAKSLTTEQIGEHIIDRSMEVYSLLNIYAKKHDIKIYNATRGGNLEIFPRVTLEDVLEYKK